MKFVYSDGGRKAAGFKGDAGDCAVRAMAIALGIPYEVAYERLSIANWESVGKRSARNGIYKADFDRVIKDWGWQWFPAPVFDGRKARCSDMVGTVIAQQARHYVAVINGVPHDKWDCNHKMVYGYWKEVAR